MDWTKIENPTIREYYRKKAQGGENGQGQQDLEAAESSQKMMQLGAGIGNFAADMSNANAPTGQYLNRWDDLGKKPQMAQGAPIDIDTSVMTKAGDKGVTDAKSKLEQYKADLKERYLMEREAEKTQVGADRWAQEAESKQTQQGIDNDFKAQSLKQQADATRASQNQSAAIREEARTNRLGERDEKRTYDEGIAAKTATAKKTEEMERLRVGDLGHAQTPDDAKVLKEAVESKASFDHKLQELIQLRTDKGVEYLDREAVARGKQLSKELLLTYKNLERLGVLSQADEAIINAIIPTDPLGQDYAPGQDPILSSLNKWKGDIGKDYDAKLKNRLRRGPENRAPGDYDSMTDEELAAELAKGG